jgi:large subunit ribosomal protein L6
MSKIGKKPIDIPEGVEISIEKRTLMAKGPKGTLNVGFSDEIIVEKSENQIIIKQSSQTKRSRALWGLTRSLVRNAIEGVKNGFEKKLELQGVGFRMAVQGKKINLALGFSHPVEVDIPEGIEAKVLENNTLSISGIDKQLVGQFAANIRALKKVEPYKGKGFRYQGEVVRRKAGKKAISTK